ncbi:MAG TPA: cation-transporting P-type ATPase [Methanoregulaceae archaeon]|nr:cation-transporting P-type ATPase [Methanoregulaceae archaeon]
MDKSLEYGLGEDEARDLLSKTGPNEIFHRRKISFLGIARHEVTEPMILLLLFVGVVYSIWGGLFDAITIFIIIALLVIAEVYNEYRAKNAIAALELIAAPGTRVIRGGMIETIDSREVVPGDMLVLVTGTKIAADSEVIRSTELQCDESALTGESFPVGKRPSDPLFAGTIIVSGEGTAKVLVTGKLTRIGQIAATAEEIRPPRTALQLAMRDLAGKLVYIAVFFSVAITLIGILRGQDIRTMILTGLSLSFATIPEELPIIITMVLGIGAYQLSRKKFLVKKLKAAETLGNATVIVTDKTGTITENKMEIAGVYPFDEREVLGVADGSLPEFPTSPLDRAIQARTGESGIAENVPAPISERDFGDGRKTRAVVRKTPDGFVLFLAGAPEEVFSLCPDLPPDARDQLEKETAQGRRVIAVASRRFHQDESVEGTGFPETDLRFGGLISFEDPPRTGVRATIERAREAGIRTIMVTGDHPLTAGAIAREVGIIDMNGSVLSGEDLDALSDAELSGTVKNTNVFARTTPEHKYRIVKALQGNGEVVAVTGDGINDTLALRGADIGIAMGIRGTDVARDSAEVVLADDNYITITQGIFEGRKFFDNLQKGIKYYLSIKSALIAIFLLPVLFGIGLPFAPIQIILLELFMDLGASAGFVSEPPERNIYTRPPGDPKKPVFDRQMVRDIGIRGAFLFTAVMGVYLVAGAAGFDIVTTQTYAFTAWIFGHIALAYTSRSEKEPLIRGHLFENRVINIWALGAIVFLLAGIYVPLLNKAFMLTPLPLYSVALVAVAVTFLIGLLELRKLIGHGSGS